MDVANVVVICMMWFCHRLYDIPDILNFPDIPNINDIPTSPKNSHHHLNKLKLVFW